ncbi:MAG: tRNA preQ1(34) S-adenosylmethionine ribosyltransferase-isomerase QueA, partial [Spirochaetaceae bacterium]|nr:tRNA preQ1(34) S-adenosylmethionine ribosyltransferase-isomerase QueA [Spirochaetaceae bacterium]
EFLFIEALESGEWDCVVDKARKKKTGQSWIFPGNVRGTITEEPAPDRRILRFDAETDESWFEEHGHMPLPPYIRRPDNPDDAERYQTVYARTTGSAAAPTAGLHFTPQIIGALQDRGVEIAWVTLQVGLGTFSPVRTEIIYDHPMHSERYSIPTETADAVGEAKRRGRPVLAVGTTSVRTLEAAWDGSYLKAGDGSTDLFIYPGYEFKVVNQIFTNFHTPESSLLMMISAFCGRERLLEAYRLALEEKYRFFSYGDAMLIR